MSSPGDVTKILLSMTSDQTPPEVLGEVLPLVHAELRRLAAHVLRSERPDHTLSPTALVNEAYLRLVGYERADWETRRHFLSVASMAMRRVLVQHAREARALKRGGRSKPIELMDVPDLGLGTDGVDLGDLDDVLERLQRFDQRKARVVELRFFAGLSVEVTAEVLGCSAPTVKREWNVARTWLYKELKGDR